jgi:hypothetical protein
MNNRNSNKFNDKDIFKDKSLNNEDKENIIQEKKIEKRKFNFAPFETINYSKFDEMKKHLDNYFIELYEFLTENKEIEGEGFKKSFFSSLENLLVQICLIKDQKIKVQKIDDVYKWYKNKIKLLNNITYNPDKKNKNINFEQLKNQNQVEKKENNNINKDNINKEIQEQEDDNLKNK